MKSSVDIGKLTAEETYDLFLDCIDAMTEEQVITALDHQLPKEMKRELVEAWKEE